MKTKKLLIIIGMIVPIVTFAKENIYFDIKVKEHLNDSIVCLEAHITNNSTTDLIFDKYYEGDIPLCQEPHIFMFARSAKDSTIICLTEPETLLVNRDRSSKRIEVKKNESLTFIQNINLNWIRCSEDFTKGGDIEDFNKINFTSDTKFDIRLILSLITPEYVRLRSNFVEVDKKF